MTDKVLEAIDALAVELGIGTNGLAFTWDQLEAINGIIAAQTTEDVANIRAHTDADYRHVVSAYGWAYANGWRAGRERAAELIEGGEG